MNRVSPLRRAAQSRSRQASYSASRRPNSRALAATSPSRSASAPASTCAFAGTGLATTHTEAMVPTQSRSLRRVVGCEPFLPMAVGCALSCASFSASASVLRLSAPSAIQTSGPPAAVAAFGLRVGLKSPAMFEKSASRLSWRTRGAPLISARKLCLSAPKGLLEHRGGLQSHAQRSRRACTQTIGQFVLVPASRQGRPPDPITLACACPP